MSVRLYYVNLYKVSKAFGGPEEGGWYYDEGLFVESAGQTPSQKGADELRGKIVEEIEKGRIVYDLERNQMGHGPHDGADPDGNGDDRYLMKGGRWGNERLVVRVQSHAGRNFPLERPYYE